MATRLEGKITFVNHEKNYAMIEYIAGGKKRVLNGSIAEKVQKEWKKKKLIKSVHYFSTNDIVEFTLDHTEKGDHQVATAIEYKYNTALDALLNKSRTDNNFLGYIKVVGDDIFIKEINCYQFIKLSTGKWQEEVEASEEPVRFYLINNEDREKVKAVLFDVTYSAAYREAIKANKSGDSVPAVVEKITPFGVYLSLFDKGIETKLPASESYTVGQEIFVEIKHLGKNKIVVEDVELDAESKK